MAFYRSELEVPINKTNVQWKGDDNFNSTNQKTTTDTSNPTLDNWCEKVKFQLHNDMFAPNSIRDNLLANDSINSSFNKFASKDVDCFSSMNMFQQLQSKIAKGVDGNMHFTASFDVKDVNPDSVKVFVKEGSVVISVEQKEIVSQRVSSTREYTRKFNLPVNVIIDSITCTLSSDNILCLDGVLECNVDMKGNSVRDMSISSVKDNPGSLYGSSLLASGRDQKYRINITIGSGYAPQDINIKTRDDKLFINARHEEKSESRTNYREFSKELTLPDHVDSLSLSAIFNNGILYIEAPYLNK